MTTVLTNLRNTLLELSTTMEIITDHDKGYQQALINIAADIEVQQLEKERGMLLKAFDAGNTVLRYMWDKDAIHSFDQYFTQTYKNEA